MAQNTPEIIIQNAEEHYTYHTSDKCVKLEELRQLVGGLYSWHSCMKYSTASRIYECHLNSENNSGIIKQFSNYKYTSDEKKFFYQSLLQGKD